VSAGGGSDRPPTTDTPRLSGGGCSRETSGYSSAPFVAITWRYHSAESLGVRFCVP
jgi:hypothetical protein